jgi:hypothetical protein
LEYSVDKVHADLLFSALVAGEAKIRHTGVLWKRP